jgi:chondroitin AC lyase
MVASLGAALMLSGAGGFSPSAAADDFSRIVDRYRQTLLGEAPGRLKPRAAREAPDVRGWMASLGPEGAWPDIDYANRDRSNWQTSLHLDRTRLMARALVDPDGPWHGEAALRAATLRALDYWLANRFQNPNWWHNRIGVPMAMRDILVLLDDQLTGERRAAALQVLDQAGQPGRGGAANTLWIAELGLQYGALTRDARRVADSSRVISDEIKITTGEGIQSDDSFHQHGARLQQFAYGCAYFFDAVRAAFLLRDTPWEIPRPKIHLLADFALRGSQWMCRGVYTAPPTLDRSVSRPEVLGSADLRPALGQLRALLPERAAELDDFIARQDGRGQPLVGARVFPRSDFTAYHRPAFSCFLKTLSNRTLPTEVGLNGENLKGALLGCGDLYLLRDGLEYFNLAPVWDWNLLPGVTYGDGAGKPQRQAFVGAVSDGQSCVTAMDYRFGARDRTLLRAHKFWACQGDVVVALIGDLTAPGVKQPVRTALDQCLWRGTVTFSDRDGVHQILSGRRENLAANWIHHAGFAYAPLGGLNISFRSGTVAGTWQSINQSRSPQTVTAPVFLAVLEHGASPLAQNSGFVIAAGSASAAEKLFAAPTWRVLRNDSHVQAVKFADGTLMAAFYRRGKVVADGQLLQVTKPCLVVQRRNRVTLMDPTQQGVSLKLRAGGKLSSLTLPGGGATLTVP